MQENEEDLMANRSQAATGINRTEPIPLTNLDHSSPMAGIQRALHSARIDLQHEVGGEHDPDLATNYESSSDDSQAAEFQGIPATAAEFQGIPATAAEFQGIPATAAEFQDIPAIAAEIQGIPAIAAEFQGIRATAAEFQGMP
jgi:hypothetical protein